MKKFLSMLFAVTLIVACGKGKEPSKEAEEDDNAPQTSTVASSTSATAPAAATMVGQPLEIKNSDTTLHNVHAMPNNNTQFNEGQPVPMSTTKKFDKAELVPFRIKCDVHGWMKAWMAVMPHPFFAVSQMNGSFTIPNLPPGTYTIVAWHEKYGPKEQQVTVAAKESKALSFSF